jgi:hypothetical protein
MERAMRKAIAGLGAAIGLAMLSGCVPPLSPVVAVAPPSTVIAAAPVTLVPPPPPPARVIHHHAAAAHPAVHHHVHRYASHRRVLASGPPYCGSAQRPCNVEHVTVPIQ